MLTKLTLTLTSEERSALQVIAQREMRGLKEQIRYMLCEEVRKRDLLPALKEDRRVAQAT
jgi:hypothetical protein